MEESMVGFVMSAIGKWSKVVVFALEPAFYYRWVDKDRQNKLTEGKNNEGTALKFKFS